MIARWLKRVFGQFAGDLVDVDDIHVDLNGTIRGIRAKKFDARVTGTLNTVESFLGIVVPVPAELGVGRGLFRACMGTAEFLFAVEVATGSFDSLDVSGVEFFGTVGGALCKDLMGQQSRIHVMNQEDDNDDLWKSFEHTCEFQTHFDTSEPIIGKISTTNDYIIVTRDSVDPGIMYATFIEYGQIPNTLINSWGTHRLPPTHKAANWEVQDDIWFSGKFPDSLSQFLRTGKVVANTSQLIFKWCMNIWIPSKNRFLESPKSPADSRKECVIRVEEDLELASKLVVERVEYKTVAQLFGMFRDQYTSLIYGNVKNDYLFLG